MGSCSSAPLEESVATTTPATFKRQEVAVAKVDTEQAPTGSSHQTAAPPGYPDASETEEYESSPESLPGPRGMDKEKKNATSKGGDKDEKPSAAQLRVGYSSGASSGSLDADEPRQGSARNHLLEIKHSISVDGDLCKAVVRIEVSSDGSRNMHAVAILSSDMCMLFRQILDDRLKRFTMECMMDQWLDLVSLVSSEE